MELINICGALFVLLLLSACSSQLGHQIGYETFRQMGYRECLKNSPRPAEDCQHTPDFDEYQREMRLRYPEEEALR
jgi:hypothetical protein